MSTTVGVGGHNIGVCSQPKMPPYPIGGYMMSDTMAASRGLKCSNNNNANVNNIYQQQPTTTRVTRRTSKYSVAILFFFYILKVIYKYNFILFITLLNIVIYNY